jgi:hypothetical protein
LPAIRLLVLLTNPLRRRKYIEVGDIGGHILVTREANKIFRVWGRDRDDKQVHIKGTKVSDCVWSLEPGTTTAARLADFQIWAI